MSQSVITALQAGDAKSLEQLYQDYAEAVLGWVIRLGGPELDAEDVAHDVFVVALRRLSSFRGEAKVSTWLYGITRKVVANARRRASLRSFLGLQTVPEPVAPGPGADEFVQSLFRRRQVQQALSQLKPKHREVLVLVDLEERSAVEVSEMTGTSLGTVYSRLHYARKRFATILQNTSDAGLLRALNAAAGQESS